MLGRHFEPLWCLRLKPCVKLVLLIPAMLAGVIVWPHAAAQSTSESRALLDQSDDKSGLQVHVIYVLPSDGIDESLDTNGTLDGSVAAMQTWLRAQTGGRALRFDTSGGHLDISFLQLEATEVEVSSAREYVRDRIEDQLNDSGFDDPNKLYAVYYAGSGNFACGGGAWAAGPPGNVAALYLKGQPRDAPPCSTNAFAASNEPPGYWEFSLLHEVLHTLGLVGTCAPHYTLAGHVSDDPRDVMYAGDQPWSPSVLDVGHDDYFDHGRADCADFARSAWLDPIPTVPAG